MRASRSTVLDFEGGGMLLALAVLLAIGMAGNARAAVLDFTGTLELHIATLPAVAIPGGGSAQVSVGGSFHLLSFSVPAGAFGPFHRSLPMTSAASLQSVRFTSIENLSGSFTGISGGPPSGGTMGLSGVARICLGFAACEYSHVPFPLAPTTGGAGFGIGGTAKHPGAVALTMQHAPWTIGQPVMTIHTPNTTISTPVLPGGFAHGPASLTSSTADRGGELQMVTATKVFTSLTGAFPEMPLFGVLHLTFPASACSDESDNDGDGFVDFPDDPGCDDAEDRSEQSEALVCDNGLDDDEDGLVDFIDDPGCDHPTDPSEQSALIACDDGSDNDGDGLVDGADPGCTEPADGAETDPDLVCDDGTDNDDDGRVDTSDPGCDDPLDPFEQNCGKLIPLTDNETADLAPAVSGSTLAWHPGSTIAWHQSDGDDFEVLLWDGSTVTPLTDNALHDMFPAMAGGILVWEEWGGPSWRILRWTGSTAVPLSEAGVDAWSPDTDGSGVVWSQGPSRFFPQDAAVYHWDGSETAQVSGSAGGMEPTISGESIVWETSAGIRMWTGSTTVVIPGSAGGHAPAVSGTQVVWHASDGSDDEVYYWDGLATQQLTHNAIDDRNADIWGNRVVWESEEGIRVRKSGATSLIAGSLGGHFPKIDGLDVVWQASDGSDNEIYLVTICMQCNDGADNDGDTKIDYDGGLSALGYVAAVADPQCDGKPWKDRERKRSSTCGLSAELAFLLPPLIWLYRRRGRLP